MNRSTGFYPSLAVVLLSFLMSSGVCFAGPGLLNYQGRLTDGKGNPVTYTVTITFTFWSAESGGEMLGGFSDSDTVTPDRDGIYSTLVGDDPGNLIPESVFERKAVWLNGNVNGEDLRPRKRLTSVGYSVQSETVQGAEVGRMSFKAAEAIKEGDVVVLNAKGEIVPTRLPGVGDAFELTRNGDISNSLRAISLAEDKVFLFYRINNTDEPWAAVVATVTGMEVTANLANEIRLPGIIFNISIAKLDNSRIIITYAEQFMCKAVVASIDSGGSIALGAPSAPFATGNEFIEVASEVVVLDSNRALIAYSSPVSPESADGESRAMIATISGTSIGFATPVTFWENALFADPDFCPVKVDENKVAIGYPSVSLAPVDYHWRLATVSDGSSISLGNVVSVPGKIYPKGSARLAADKALWTYSDTDYNVLRIRPLFISDGALAMGNLVSIASSVWRPAIANLHENYCLVFHKALAYPITGSGNSIALGNSIQYLGNANVEDTMCAELSPTRVLVGYSEQEIAFLRVLDTEKIGGARPYYDNRIGVAERAAQAGEECLVTIPGGVTKQFSGLIPGKDYFVTEKGISDTGVLRIGVALTPDKLLICR